MTRKMVAMRFDEDLLAAFDAIATAKKLTRTAAIEKAMRRVIEGEQAKPSRTVEPRLKGKP